MNIYEKMLAISSEVGTVAKNLQVTFGRGTYKAVSEADVLAAVKPLEIKHGIYSYPAFREILESGVMTNYYDGKERSQVHIRVKTIYRFVNTENPEETIDIISYGDGVDSQDKAPGKAMTYADKYALLKAYKIQTGEDPDQEESKPLTRKRTKVGLEMGRAMEERVLAAGGTVEKVCSQYNVPSLSDMTEEQYQHLSNRLAAANNHGNNGPG